MAAAHFGQKHDTNPVPINVTLKYVDIARTCSAITLQIFDVQLAFRGC